MIDKRFESGELINTESGEECNYSIQDFKGGEKAVRDIVDKEAAQIVNAIVVSQDEKEITNYLDKFNRNMSKKNLLRILKYNELLDKVGDEALNRIENHPDELTATELLNYMKVMQDSINAAKKETSPVDGVNPITLNQQNNNVTVNVNSEDRVSRQSKEKIMEAVKQLLKLSLETNENKDTIIDVESNNDIKKEN